MSFATTAADANTDTSSSTNERWATHGPADTSDPYPTSNDYGRDYSIYKDPEEIETNEPQHDPPTRDTIARLAQHRIRPRSKARAPPDKEYLMPNTPIILSEHENYNLQQEPKLIWHPFWDEGDGICSYCWSHIKWMHLFDRRCLNCGAPTMEGHPYLGHLNHEPRWGASIT